MIKRYSDPKITENWSDETRVSLWQKTELAVIEAREKLGRIPSKAHHDIQCALEEHRIDITWWLEREKVIKHDPNAFLEERLRWLTPEQQVHFHKQMTSYDTEEPTFAALLRYSCEWVRLHVVALQAEIKTQALRYRYTPMNARTHGQEAELQSFGKRLLSWYTDLQAALDTVGRTIENLQYSKLSGTIGTNSGIDPELERETLGILGLQPWYGATQIMPRVLYSPVASALADLVTVADKIAHDIRLGARSGRPLYHEPFTKEQKGSSAMPHKKNPIGCEKIEGMARMARAYAAGIKENIKTWEERAIEQSSVERVFWPDIFHVTVHALKTLTTIVKELVVYPDNMLLEIVDSHGTYASNEAKELLAEIGLPFGLDREAAYQIVKLASFNACAPTPERKELREGVIDSLVRADSSLYKALRIVEAQPQKKSIQHIIELGNLTPHESVAADVGQVRKWWLVLEEIFSIPENRHCFAEIFKPSHILKNEAHLFKHVFGE